MNKVKISELKEIIKKEKNVLVSFKTEWCGVCKINAPMVRNVYERNKSEITFLEVDVDKEDLWKEDGNEEFSILLVPTYNFYSNGEKKWEQNNFVLEVKFEEIIKKYKI